MFYVTFLYFISHQAFKAELKDTAEYAYIAYI